MYISFFFFFFFFFVFFLFFFFLFFCFFVFFSERVKVKETSNGLKSGIFPLNNIYYHIFGCDSVIIRDHCMRQCQVLHIEVIPV